MDHPRRVDVGDLVAIAIALGVSPATLLIPESETAGGTVTVTGGAGTVAAQRCWEWLTAAQPLPEARVTLLTFGARAWPQWEHKRIARAGLDCVLRDPAHDQPNESQRDGND
jgi:hypothetical protein